MSRFRDALSRERENKGGGRKGDGLEKALRGEVQEGPPPLRFPEEWLARTGIQATALAPRAGQMLWLLPVSDGSSQVKGSWPTDALRRRNPGQLLPVAPYLHLILRKGLRVGAYMCGVGVLKKTCSGQRACSTFRS